MCYVRYRLNAKSVYRGPEKGLVSIQQLQDDPYRAYALRLDAGCLTRSRRTRALTQATLSDIVHLFINFLAKLGIRSWHIICGNFLALA